MREQLHAEFVPARMEGQPGQGDERVAPPCPEPRVARHHRRFAVRAAHKEFFPFVGKVALQRFGLPRRFRAAFGLFLPEGFHELALTVRDVKRLRGSREEHGFAGGEADFKDAGLEEVFLIVEAAFLLDHVLHVAVPVGLGIEDRIALRLHVQGGQGVVGFHAEAVGGGKGFGAQNGVGARQPVRVAEGQQRLDAQDHGRGVRPHAAHFVAQDEQPPSRDEHEFAAQRDLAETVAEHRPFTDLHLLQIFVAARVVDPGMLAAGKEKLPLAHEQRFLDGGEQDVAAYGPFEIGHEQAVVLARVASEERTGSVIPQSVGFNPLFAERFSDILAGRFIETELHAHSFQRKEGEKDDRANEGGGPPVGTGGTKEGQGTPTGMREAPRERA